MINKRNIVYLILGLGLGIIITNLLHSAYPKIEFLELDDNAIIERSRELGMVSIKEAIKVDKEAKVDELEESEEVETEDDVTEEETIEEAVEATTEVENLEERLVVIENGMYFTEISDLLYEKGLIEDEYEFANLVRLNDLSKKFSMGEYKIKNGSSYSEIIKLLTGVNPQIN